MKYLLVDTTNTFFRARHVARRGSTIEEKTALAVHITLTSISKLWREQKPDHVVFCLEGHSWRKNEYLPYKKNREAAKVSLTEREVKEDIQFWAAYETLITFLDQKTNCSVLQSKNAEADDLVARFIALHPADEHVILSSDSDLLQLIDDNVYLFNGITGHTWTKSGVYDLKKKPVIDKKTKQPKGPVDPEWIVFEKCIRGDSSDNIFSAYPRVNINRMKDAFNDRKKKGYSWNNVMLQQWVDHRKVEHKVIEDYERNRKLIDLTAQPEEIRNEIDRDIMKRVKKAAKSQVGTQFILFCGKQELDKLVEYAETFADIFSKEYNNGQ